jgi:hypothetical protein
MITSKRPTLLLIGSAKRLTRQGFPGPDIEADARPYLVG